VIEVKAKNDNGRCFAICILLISGILLSPQQAMAGEDTRLKIDEYIRAYVEMDLFSGSVLVAKGDEILLEKGYGKADIENDIQNTPDTKFRIGSLTKSFTAMAIMQLVEKGKLSLDDKLTKFIPDYPNGDKITIHNLLTHTSGIFDHTELPDYDTQRRVEACSVEKTISTFKDKPLQFEPGSKFEYSNSNYILLGFIIEKVSDQAYGQYIEESIFKPLAMNNSGFEYPDRSYKNFALGYVIENCEITRAKSRVMSNGHASGALYSTVHDMYLWDRALYTTKLISRDGLDKMFEPFKGDYGYGWVIDRLNDRKVIRHGSDSDGYQTNISRFPQDDVCIIILSNLQNFLVTKISEDIAAIIFGKPYQLPQKEMSTEQVFRYYPDYVGTYQLKADLPVEITMEEDKLFCQAKGQAKFQLHPESPNTFFPREFEAKFVFVRDENGKVTELILYQSGHEVHAPKIK
jgi:CubicO group peptidase (beta-lactamase class C family)